MRPRLAWKQVLKALGGFAAGVALWAGFSPFYRQALVPPAELILHLTEPTNVTELLENEGGGIIVNRSDFPPESPRPGVATRDLTFNVVLLCALFALSRKTFSNSNVAGFGLAMIVLWLTHILAVVVRVKKIYAFQLGEWSMVHYGDLSRNVWGSLDHFYRVIGMFAVAFVLWWFLRGENWPLRRSRARSKRDRR
ncbi:MAG: hypothetical protein R3338_05705 [Thermoanaerobaculia bacterium]|nr:hypothetical protein [Thermoanaerobaculia bacterium]